MLSVWFITSDNCPDLLCRPTLQGWITDLQVPNLHWVSDSQITMYVQSYLTIWSDMTPANIVCKYLLSVHQPTLCQPGMHPHSYQLSLLNHFQTGQDSSLTNLPFLYRFFHFAFDKAAYSSVMFCILYLIVFSSLSVKTCCILQGKWYNACK